MSNWLGFDFMAQDDAKVALNRLKALSDGVFAIVLTFLMFRLDLSALANIKTDEDLWGQLQDQLVDILSFALSFFILGSFWLTHHRVFAAYKHCTSYIMALNLGFLFFVTLLPISLTIHTQAPNLQSAWMIYAAVVSAAAMCQLAMWLRGCRQRLIHESVTPLTRAYMIYKISLLPIVFLASIQIAGYRMDWMVLTPVVSGLLSGIVTLWFGYRHKKGLVDEGIREVHLARTRIDSAA
jgi:uncharacterized membrane protein